MRLLIPFWLLLTALAAQAEEDEYRVYTDHPRLILTSQRLRLLKRERERESQRWRQFDLLVKGSASLPEPGFALALYYAVSGDQATGQRAIDWALGPAAQTGSDLRQLALVYDWCQPILRPEQAAALAAKIRQAMAKAAGEGISGRRDRILALIASADDSRHSEEAPLKALLADYLPSHGPGLPPLPDLYAVLEILHAVRDNLKFDLRQDAPSFFVHLPTYLIAANYPAPFQAPENLFRIPVYQDANQPDLKQAALARAAGLSMVALDNNGLESQFLQGWLIQDRFLMMTSFGAPYEFLWANPYQPGLSYYELPLLFHDPDSGALFIRSAWDESADWFGLWNGEAELFHDGRMTVENRGTVRVGDASVVFGSPPFQFHLEGATVLVIGLKPHQKYLIETDDEEMREVGSDRAGTLVIEYPAARAAGVRIHE